MSGYGEPTVVASGLRFPEGPAAMPDGSVLVVEIERGTLTRIEADGTARVIAELGGGPNGLAIGPDGAAYVCNNGGFIWANLPGDLILPTHSAHDQRCGSIQRVDLTDGTVSTLYDHCDGVALSGPNDLVFDAHGGFWFTDHGHNRTSGRDHGALYYAKADGSAICCQRTDMIGPNGVGLSPDGATLYVAETMTARLWAMAISAPGVLAEPPPFMPGKLIGTTPAYRLFDSLAVEADGRVCIGTLVEGGITLFTPHGDHEFVALPGIGITNIAFGGSDLRDAFITSSPEGVLYKMRWPRPGLALPYSSI